MALREVAGLAVRVSEYGKGARPALLMHCSLAHSGAWAGMMAHLDDLLRATAFDLPGHGGSAALPEGRDLLDQTTAIAGALIGEPAVVIGHSFSAIAALHLGLERPELVRALVLIEPVLFAAAHGTEEFSAHEEAMLPFAESIARGRPAEAARHFMALWGDGRPWQALPEAQRSYLAERIHLIPAGYPATHEDRPRLLAPGRLEALGLPVLLLEGAASPPVIGAIGNVLFHRLSNATRRVIPGAGHMLPVTHPEQSAGAIRDFLRADAG